MATSSNAFTKSDKITSTWLPFDRCLAISWINNYQFLCLTQALLPEAMLVVRQDIELVEVVHDATVYDMLQDLTCY